MPNEEGTWKDPTESCLADEDLYGYISGKQDSEKLVSAEAHLAECPRCRKALADLLELLHPQAEAALQENPSLSEKEIEKTLTLIREVSKKESGKTGFSPRFKWATAAAAAIAIIALSSLGLNYVINGNKSETYYVQAKAEIEKSYTGASPSNLRLDLPFDSKSTDRMIDGHETLQSAKDYLNRALGVRDGMVEAKLGLGYIYLESKDFEDSHKEFQQVLDAHPENIGALIGRGAAMYEQAVQQGIEPNKRVTLLDDALKDFNSALKLNPDSLEARYNKACTLYESARHKEALQEIEEYLSRDSESLWADKLKDLKTKIEATDPNAVEEGIEKAAHRKDIEFLEKVAGQVPYQMPPAIWTIMRRSLQLDMESSARGKAESKDLQWAAGVVEEAYSATAGDGSFRVFIDFYDGLSPPQRKHKNALDQNFQNLVNLHKAGKFEEVLHRSKPFEEQYSALNDSWQLFNLHLLRGNSLYMGRTDFDGAYAEYQKMYKIGNDLNSPYLIGNALVSLATICGEQGHYSESLDYADKLEDLAKSHHFDLMQAYAYRSLGDNFRRLGQWEKSLPNYSNALGFSNRLHNETQAAEILENIGVVMGRLGRYQQAKNFFDMALQRLERGLGEGTIEDRPETTLRRLNLLYQQGELAVHTGDPVSAQAFFEKSLESTPKGMREIKARDRIGLAEVYMGRKDFQKADEMLQAVFAVIASDSYPEVEWQARFIKGEIYERNGEYKKALSSYQQAIGVLERIRKSIGSEDLKQSFFTDRFSPYKAIVALLNNTIKNRQEALEFVDRAKSKTLREYLKLPELAGSKPVNLTAAAFDSDSVSVVEYFFTNDGLIAFINNGDHIESVPLPVSADALSPLVEKYLDSIGSNDSKEFLALSRRLYDNLIGPIEHSPQFVKSDTLVILPDGPLHLLPFGGLQDGESRFLIERKSLVFAPSRSVLNYCLHLNRPMPPDNKPEVLLIDGSSGLASARNELANLKKRYGENAFLAGPKDVPFMNQEAARAQIIHFAGHVTSKNKPVLVLQKSPEEVDLDFSAIGAWKLQHAQLANLAGCSSAIGPIGEGEAPWGLIPAFLNAGAPSIVASLTPVDDAATEQLNREFYDGLQKHTGKAKALRNAQIALLNAARFNHEIKPQSWVPYILIGDPQ